MKAVRCGGLAAGQAGGGGEQGRGEGGGGEGGGVSWTGGGAALCWARRQGQAWGGWGTHLVASSLGKDLMDPRCFLVRFLGRNLRGVREGRVASRSAGGGGAG